MKLKNHPKLLVFTAALITTHLTQAGPCQSRPILHPITMPIPPQPLTDETKAGPKEVAAATTVQRYYRQHLRQTNLVLQALSLEVHQILNSSTALDLTGTPYAFEDNLAFKLIQPNLDDPKTTKKAFHLNALATQRWHTTQIAKQFFPILERKDLLRGACQNLPKARNACATIFRGYCALNYHIGQVEQNNPKYILEKLYEHGLPRPKPTQIDHPQELK